MLNQHKRRPSRAAITGGALIALLAAAGCGVAATPAQNQAPAGGHTASSTAASPTSITTDPTTTAAADSAPPSTAPTSSLAGHKQQLITKGEQEALSSNRSKPPLDSTPTLVPIPSGGVTRSAGIDNHVRSGPVPTSTFTVSSFYQGPWHGDWYQLFSGRSNIGETQAQQHNPATGEPELRLYRENGVALDGKIKQVGVYPVPTVKGPLIIKSVKHGRASLEAPSGRTYLFNLTTHAITSGH